MGLTCPRWRGRGRRGGAVSRTELQVPLLRSKMPKRLRAVRVVQPLLDAATGKRVVFRTLDIGSDKVAALY